MEDQPPTIMEVLTLKAEISNLKDEVDKLKQTSTDDANINANLWRENNALRFEAGNLKQRCTDDANTIANLEVENSRLNSMGGFIDAELDNIKDTIKLKDAQLEKLDKEMTELSTSNNRWTVAYGELQTFASTDMFKKEADFNTQISIKDKDLSAAYGRMQQLEAETDSLTNKLKVTTSVLHEVKTNWDVLSREHQDCKDVEGTTVQLNEQIDQIHADMYTAEVHHAKKLKEAEYENKQLKRTLESYISAHTHGNRSSVSSFKAFSGLPGRDLATEIASSPMRSGPSGLDEGSQASDYEYDQDEATETIPALSREDSRLHIDIEKPLNPNTPFHFEDSESSEDSSNDPVFVEASKSLSTDPVIIEAPKVSQSKASTSLPSPSETNDDGEGPSLPGKQKSAEAIAPFRPEAPQRALPPRRIKGIRATIARLDAMFEKKLPEENTSVQSEASQSLPPPVTTDKDIKGILSMIDAMENKQKAAMAHDENAGAWELFIRYVATPLAHYLDPVFVFFVLSLIISAILYFGADYYLLRLHRSALLSANELTRQSVISLRADRFFDTKYGFDDASEWSRPWSWLASIFELILNYFFEFLLGQDTPQKVRFIIERRLGIGLAGSTG